MGIIRGKRRSRARLVDLQIHRLQVFREVFDKYLRGETDAAHVTRRAEAMIAVGLPGQRPKKVKK